MSSPGPSSFNDSAANLLPDPREAFFPSRPKITVVVLSDADLANESIDSTAQNLTGRALTERLILDFTTVTAHRGNPERIKNMIAAIVKRHEARGEKLLVVKLNPVLLARARHAMLGSLMVNLKSVDAAIDLANSTRR